MKIGVIAFSGGLDTSFLAAYCREKYALDRVVTCTVNTGGFGPEEERQIAARAKECGADEHVLVNAESDFYKSVIKYLIFGNVTRDGYPLSVGSERLIQATKALEVAKEHGATMLFHGSTGAGNDQYRFDVAIHVLGQGAIQSIAPVREMNLSRTESSEFLRARGIAVAEKATSYSYNVGLWGVSIGGTETHSSEGLIPEAAWYSKPDPSCTEGSVTVTFEHGEPVGLTSQWGEASSPVDVIKLCTQIGNTFAIGRRYHVGTSIPGKKGRLAYEAPAAELIYEAHRTLEKLVLTQSQIQTKQFLANEVGKFVHEARFFDPYLEDLQAFLVSSQRRVTGTATLQLAPGYIKSAVANSPYNMLAAKGAIYGETSTAYTGADAEGSAKLYSMEQMIYRQLG